MFIGHYALGYASKRSPQLPSLALLFLAAQLLDFMWPILVLTGFEHFKIEEGSTALTPLEFTFYPYSHSLLMAVVWGALFGLIYYFFTKNNRGSIILFALVVSHWVLDFITHKPDLQLSPFSETRVGLSLWNFPAAEIAFETALFAIGVLLYYTRMKPKRKFAFWSLVIVFLLIHFMNLFGPPPPSVQAVAWSANLMWLFILWAVWIEAEKKKPITD